MPLSDQYISVKLAKTLLKLFPVEIPLTSDDKDNKKLIDRARTEYEDEVTSGFNGHFDDLNETIIGKKILDLGSGYGGRTVRYSELGAESVTGIEISDAMNCIAADFASEKKVKNVRFITAFGENLPFENESFDIVTCYDVLEHVDNPRATLSECFRVLKDGGRMFIVFPPYYSIYGSHLYGYISLLPFANLLFSSRTLITAIDQILEESGTGFRPLPLRPDDKLYTLNGLTIKQFTSDSLAAGFAISSMALVPVSMPQLAKEMFINMRLLFMKVAGIPVSIISHLLFRVPLLREVFANKIVCILDKGS